MLETFGQAGLSGLDLIVLSVLVLASVIYSFMISKGQILPILVSTYMAYVLVSFTPFLDSLAETFQLESIFILQAVLFGVLFLIVLYILFGIVFQTPVGAETFGVWMAFLAAFLQVGFLIAVFFSFLPDKYLSELSYIVRLVFVSETGLFFWAVAPIVFLLFLGRRVNRRLSDVDDEYYEEE